MSITIVIISSALASTLGASLATFFIQKYFDRRLEYYFNSRLEELKATLNIQGDIKNQITSRRLEIYPRITELLYRLRNKLKEICQADPLPLEQVVDFLRLAEQYTEQIYSARLYLELDHIFEPLHDYKSHILTTKNLLLDWIYLTRQDPSENVIDINKVMTRLQEAYSHLDYELQRLIQSLTRLTQT